MIRSGTRGIGVGFIGLAVAYLLLDLSLPRWAAIALLAYVGLMNLAVAAATHLIELQRNLIERRVAR